MSIPCVGEVGTGYPIGGGDGDGGSAKGASGEPGKNSGHGGSSLLLSSPQIVKLACHPTCREYPCWSSAERSLFKLSGSG